MASRRRKRTAGVVDRVGEIVKGRLNQYDHTMLGAGEIRWRNTAEWCRNTIRVLKNGEYRGAEPL